MKQPTSLKVIAWINILASVIGFCSVFYILWDGWRTLGYVVSEAIPYLIFAFVVSSLVIFIFYCNAWKVNHGEEHFI